MQTGLREFSELYTNGEYLKKNPTWHVNEAPWKASEIMRMLARNHLAHSRVCEVGCGAGEILRLLQSQLESDCQFVGYEISPQAYDMCQSRANERLQFKLMDVREDASNHFDVILLMDVLEHMEDFFSFARDIHPLSTYKIVHLPLDVSVRTVLRNHIVDTRADFGHIHYFTAELALQAMKDLGYEVLDHFYTREPLDLPLRKRLRKIPGRVAFRLNEDLAARIFGDWRILLLLR